MDHNYLNATLRLAHWDTEFRLWEEGKYSKHARESSSGVGSTIKNTRNTVQTLDTVIVAKGVTSMVDLPCGDWNWMSTTITRYPDVVYTGMDIAASLIARNRENFPNYSFALHDVVQHKLPKKVDLVLNRDMLFHVPPAQGLQALRNIAASGSKYLLSTTFPKGSNEDIVLKHPDGGGIWYRINLIEPPFLLPPALSMHVESEGQGKFLGLWDLHDANLRAALGLPSNEDLTAWNSQGVLRLNVFKTSCLCLVFIFFWRSRRWASRTIGRISTVVPKIILFGGRRW